MPLRYAVQDASAMKSFLEQDADFDQIFYFSDDSPEIATPKGPLHSLPTYANLKRFLRKRFQSPFLNASDNLWFFFAGHGERHEGHDYLMPIDVDPGNLEETALKISDISAYLRNSGADNTVLLLDACRSQGRRGPVGIGTDEQPGVVMICSCSPRQSSYEIDEIGHGSFTHALLSGFRLQGEKSCATVHRIDEYLQHQVPRLNKRYQKPTQTPYTAVSPASKYRLILLPGRARSDDVESLKKSAYRAETANDWDFAAQLWTRVLAASQVDQEAINAFQRIALNRIAQPPASQAGALTTADSPEHLIAASSPSSDSPATFTEASQMIGLEHLSRSPSYSTEIEQHQDDVAQLLEPKRYVGESHVAIVPSVDGLTEKQLILIDSEVSQRWGYRPEDICVYRDINLSTAEPRVIEAIQRDQRDIDFVHPEDIFLPELKFIDSHSEAIPGGLMPESDQPIVFAEESVTPLLPFSSILLDYLSPEDLVSRTKFSLISGDEPQVKISLDLPLSGVQPSAEFENYRLTKIYPLTEENALRASPVLELWPNFKAKGWRAYYAFFFDLGAGDMTFRIRLRDSAEVESFKDDQGGSYVLARMEEFPSAIECVDNDNHVIGLILPRQPIEISPSADWKIGVDFSSSFTNIHTEQGGRTQPLQFDDSLLLKVIDSPLDTRFPCLFNYFVPDRFLPVEKPLPLANVLTTRGSNRPLSSDSRAILDGRIYNPSVRDFNPNADWIETDLTQIDSYSTLLFLRHLILHLSANALKQGASRINWIVSYPSVFSKKERELYAASWMSLLEESNAQTGITHRFSSDSENFRTRSISLAQYFADYERADMVYSTCVDMGSNTSDISIWQDNRLLHQCSIKIASKDFLSDILELNPAFIVKHFDRPANEWMGLRGADFQSKLDVLLRWESNDWLSRKRPTLTDSEDAAGLFRLMVIGFSGVYYYIGLILNVLRERREYRRDFPTPVYIGGGGSQLLHWLDPAGRFCKHSEINLLFNRVLSRGADIEDTEEGTLLSPRPKDEVACGLVLGETKLSGIGDRSHYSLIPGEAYRLNAQNHDWNEPIVIEEDVDNFKIVNINNLNIFLYEFHKALKDMRIEGIHPLPGYKLSLELSDNAKLWRGTQRKLDNLLLIEEYNMIGKASDAQIQPPFIIGLKALLQYLGKEWAGM